MAEKKSSFLNMVLTLFLVTFFSAFILGFVQDMTHDAIVESKMKAQNDAIKNILPQFKELGEPVKAPCAGGGDSLEIFPAYGETKELVGVAVKSWSKNGFGGLIQIMAGFSPEGNITGYQVLEHKETPGLGSKMDFWFKNSDKPGQCVIGKNPGRNKLTVKKDGGEIDAITASTITSRAFLESLRRAYETYRNSHVIPAEGGLSPAGTSDNGGISL